MNTCNFNKLTPQNKFNAFLNTQAMRTVKEYYLGAFSADNLFGFRMIISFSSLLILLYCIFLAALVWRAKSKGFENKFMSVLLVCEGIKASFIVSQTTPYISHTLHKLHPTHTTPYTNHSLHKLHPTQTTPCTNYTLLHIKS